MYAALCLVDTEQHIQQGTLLQLQPTHPMHIVLCLGQCLRKLVTCHATCRVGQLRAQDLILLAGVALLQKAEEDNSGAQGLSRILVQALQIQSAQQIWSLDLQAAGLPFDELVWLAHSLHAASSYEVRPGCCIEESHCMTIVLHSISEGHQVLDAPGRDISLTMGWVA